MPEARPMRVSRVPILLLLTLVLAACGGAGRTPSPAPEASSAAWLRARTHQALPPVHVFAAGPTAVVTGDGAYVTPGATAAIHPGPLLPALVGRPISDAGRDAILAEAERLGLLGRKTDFLGPGSMPGSVTGTIELTVDGAPRVLRGEPGAQMLCVLPPCDPIPGTPEAFGDFWRRLADPAAWLADDLGPEAPFDADAYAILVGPPSDPDPSLGAQVQVWPLDQPPSEFGGPVANGTYRCGIASGADADALRPALEAADQLTQWVADETTSATFGLTVRPIIAGEDPCAETFGT